MHGIDIIYKVQLNVLIGLQLSISKYQISVQSGNVSKTKMFGDIGSRNQLMMISSVYSVVITLLAENLV